MSTACTTCAATLAQGARFCGACGAVAPEPADDARAVERYRAVLANFTENGALEARELAQLETLRERLGVSYATHERLLDEVEERAPAPLLLRMYIDVSTMRHFEVAARCMIRLRAEHRGDLAFERLDVHAQVLGGRALEPASAGALFPGQSQVLSLWLVPELAGFHELRAVVHAVDLMGEPAFYAFDSVQFRVGSAGQGPAISVVHLDQRSARVVDNSRTSFAAPAPESGGLVSDGLWQPLPLRALSHARAAHLAPRLARLPAETASSASGSEPTPSGRERISSTPAAGPAAGSIDFRIDTAAASYHVTRALAQGDLATVYGGRRQDGAPVAVKIADAFEDNDLMQAEVRALELLRQESSPQHKHLPLVLDRFRTSDGRMGTVFEHIDGYDLYTLRDKLPGGVPARHILWIMRRCLSALGWAHSRGVLHGNLDPAHIMVRPHDHNVWLVDWCYAIVNPARTGQGFRCLNEEYSPPEVAQRKPPLPSSDLYSLGKCMIYALGGDPQSKELPEAPDEPIDDRLARFLRFFVQESPLGRAQDAWDMYTQLDRLRADIYGRHTFVELEV